MSDTGSVSEITEYFDSNEQIEDKAKKLATFIKESEHFVVFTGAGVSTAAKIPDYRGPKGIWTLKARGETVKVNLLQAEPTFTHMALVTLFRNNYLKFIVSTNVDGLHRRSGIPEEGMAELHGNIFREYCTVCGCEYLRPFDIRTGELKNGVPINRHTGRLCEKKDESGKECLGKLRDSIVNFGENLPEHALDLAFEHSKAADLILVLGSSMLVSPACDLPSLSYKHGGKFSLVNLQKTNYDRVAEKHDLRIFGKCDDVLRIVLAELNLSVDGWNTEDDTLNQLVEGLILDPDFESTKL